MSEELQPVTWLKWKYASPKSKGTYKGGGGQNHQRTKRKKTGGGPSPVEQVKVLTAAGRVRWEQRPRQKTR